MAKLILGNIILFFISVSGFAQGTTGQSGTGANMDIKHHRFEWFINPDQAKRISGSVTTYFVTTTNNVSNLTFDFYKSSFNNSNLIVKYHGSTVSHSFPNTGNVNILKIALPVSLSKGVLDSVTIFYDGVPPEHSGSLPAGCKQKPAYSGGPNIFYTLSESYEDKDWWPCKADMQDKIDSLTFIITVPAAYTPIVNGVLISTVTSGANKVFTYKHRYPIASYLVSVAVSKYDFYDRGTVNISGTPVPVEYYIAKGRANNSTALNVMDQCKEEMVIFSQLYGDYPYKKEKYGMYEFLFSGGMEHQTMSGMSYGAMLKWDIVAHELMHQWFGDKVTMATWNHLWLSEGFASYGEVLAAEFVSSIGVNPATARMNKKLAANNTTQSNYGCYVPDPNIENSTTLWTSQYGKTVYSRGAMVVSMLRTLMGDDKFFAACRNYLNDPRLAYNSAVTNDLKAHLEAALDGFDLTGFFNSFVYGNGFPNYGKNGSGNPIHWQAVGSDSIRLRVDAPAKSAGSNVSVYHSVIPLRVQGNGGKDTVIVLYDQGAAGVSVGGNGIVIGHSPTVELKLGFRPVAVSFDPFYMSLAEGTTVESIVVPVSVLSFSVTGNDHENKAYLKVDNAAVFSRVVLEKSTDSNNFVDAGEMKNLGNGEFSYVDVVNSDNYLYYRVRLEEPTGEISYSRVVRIIRSGYESFSMAINPVRSNIRVKIPSSAMGEMLYFTVFDIRGRKILTDKKTVLSSEVKLSRIPAIRGAYILHIQGNNINTSLRFIVN